MKFYEWQENIINCEGDCTIRGGRQSGKSWAVAEQIRRRAIKYPKSRHLILAATERQENYLFDKFKELYGKEKSKYIGRVTLGYAKLKNGTEIFKYPVGQTGIYIEGLSSIDFIYIDEAIHVGHKVFDSILPMLVEPKKRGLGWLTLLSATRGRPKGYFFDSFKSKYFIKFQVKTEDCEHVDKEFLKKERQRLGERLYKVIYEGEFDENAHKYFPKELIEKAVKIPYFNKNKIIKGGNYYLGIDPALLGRSKAVWAVSEIIGKDEINLIYAEEKDRCNMLFLRDKTIQLAVEFGNFRKIFVDNGGLGQGFVDILEDVKQFKHRIRELNNKSATINKGRILKEDLYSNLLMLLELEKIKIVNDPKIIKGLLDVEIDEEERIIGTDMSEACVRACWCSKEKSIKPFIVSF